MRRAEDLARRIDVLHGRGERDRAAHELGRPQGIRVDARVGVRPQLRLVVETVPPHAVGRCRVAEALNQEIHELVHIDDTVREVGRGGEGRVLARRDRHPAWRWGGLGHRDGAVRVGGRVAGHLERDDGLRAHVQRLSVEIRHHPPRHGGVRRGEAGVGDEVEVALVEVVGAGVRKVRLPVVAGGSVPPEAPHGPGVAGIILIGAVEVRADRGAVLVGIDGDIHPSDDRARAAVVGTRRRSMVATPRHDARSHGECETGDRAAGEAAPGNAHTRAAAFLSRTCGAGANAS